MTFGLGNDAPVSAHDTPQSEEAGFGCINGGMGDAQGGTNGAENGHRGKFDAESVAAAFSKLLTFVETADRALADGDLDRVKETLGGLRALLEGTLTGLES